MPRRPVATYPSDLNGLLDSLKVGEFACLGESSGGMVTLTVAATMAPRVIGAVRSIRPFHGSTREASRRVRWRSPIG